MGAIPCLDCPTILNNTRRPMLWHARSARLSHALRETFKQTDRRYVLRYLTHFGA